MKLEIKVQPVPNSYTNREPEHQANLYVDGVLTFRGVHRDTREAAEHEAVDLRSRLGINRRFRVDPRGEGAGDRFFIEAEDAAAALRSVADHLGPDTLVASLTLTDVTPE